MNRFPQNLTAITVMVLMEVLSYPGHGKSRLFWGIFLLVFGLYLNLEGTVFLPSLLLLLSF